MLQCLLGILRQLPCVQICHSEHMKSPHALVVYKALNDQSFSSKIMLGEQVWLFGYSNLKPVFLAFERALGKKKVFFSESQSKVT